MTMELYCRKVTSRLVGCVVLAVSSVSGGGSLGLPVGNNSSRGPD